MPTKQDEIAARAKTFADARDKLQQLVDALNEGLEQLKRDNLPGIRRQVNRVAQLQAELTELVKGAPEHFVKPRTLVLHGIKLGFQKEPGSIAFDDADKVVELIEKKLPDLAELLIKTEKKPLKKGLQQLTVQQLKSIGCTVTDAGDRVVVQAVDGAVEKLVTALLKGVAVEQEATA